MKKYEALCDCYGFQGRYWFKGEIAEVNGGEKSPPKHFKEIGAPAPVAEVAAEKAEIPAKKLKK